MCGHLLTAHALPRNTAPVSRNKMLLTSRPTAFTGLRPSSKPQCSRITSRAVCQPSRRAIAAAASTSAESQIKETISSTAMLFSSQLALASIAWADETPAVEAATKPPPNPAELLLVLAPILIYGVFYWYREKLNPKATISDLLLIVAFLIILGNIFSIVVFKTRLF